MTGRKIFHSVKPLLSLFSIIFFILPRAVCEFLWVVTNLLPSFIGIPFRFLIAKRLCKSIGESVYFGRYITIKNWSKLKIGDNCSFHEYCYIDALGGIEIGNNVSIAHNCSIVSFNHTWHDETLFIKYNKILCSQITIDSDVWLGAGVRMLSGSQLRSRTVVAAASVVNKKYDCSGVMIGGVPSKIIKRLDDES
ncbi:acyltransferase [Vibrio metschnikovii]|nr:acyltransferase [Vibrio metschnikovii]EKO3604868.1 acyltransferase [Vibrio metschnikovii]EKQ5812226.1 acyltransferase [Vibrio metschnikovii]